jgi:hypothetical protein
MDFLPLKSPIEKISTREPFTSGVYSISFVMGLNMGHRVGPSEAQRRALASRSLTGGCARAGRGRWTTPLARENLK